MINHLIWCHITLHISLKELKGCSFVLLVVKIQHGSHVLYWEIIKLINNHSSKNNSRNYLDKIISKQRHAYLRLETSLLLFCLPCAKHNWICLPWLACSCGWKSEEERERERTRQAVGAINTVQNVSTWKPIARSCCRAASWEMQTRWRFCWTSENLTTNQNRPLE